MTMPVEPGMTFDADLLLARLAELQGEYAALRYVVGFSGGLDSLALLHALAASPERHGIPVVAMHVNHGLHPAAAEWQERCRAVAGQLGVDFMSTEVEVKNKGVGIEAAAREARYAAMAERVRDGDVLLSAHHADDQAETLLLNLMRGSGVRGLAGIGAVQPFGPALLVRPMLGVSRQAIEAYARRAGLHWIEDPANSDARFDRNFLRREIVPRLRQRWPAASSLLARSARLVSEAAGLQEELARIDLATLVDDPSGPHADRADRLDLPALRRLGAARQRNVLRHAIRACGLPAAPASRLRQVQQELLPAPADAQPLVRWPGGEIRRYRDKLYLLADQPDRAADAATGLPRLRAGGGDVPLGAALGALRLVPCVAGEGRPAIDPAVATAGLDVRFRSGGERIRPHGGTVSRPLKKLLQERGVVPWMRRNLPLLYAGDELVAVADLWIAAEYAHEGGLVVCWSGKPSLF